MKNRMIRLAAASALLSIVTALFSVSYPSVAHAATLSSGSQEYRNRIIKVCGIVDDTENTAIPATRAQFAYMLVKSGSYKDSASSAGIPVAPDVPGNHEYAGHIMLALRNGWMRNRITGNFDPEGPVTLNDAAKAAMALLGYSDQDLGANITEGRLALFRGLELDKGVNAASGNDFLTVGDCINFFYNLLSTKTGNSGSIYGSAINLSLSADGEINANELIETTLEGPVLVKNKSLLSSSVPFPLEESTLYYNGRNCGSYRYGRMYYESQLNNYGWIILYYNTYSKTIWAYGADTGGNTYHCVRGTVNSIYYESDNIVSPSSVTVDYTDYTLSGSEVKFMFSVNGEINTGDEVVLICRDNTNSSGETTMYSAVGVVKYKKDVVNTVSESGPSGSEGSAVVISGMVSGGPGVN